MRWIATDDGHKIALAASGAAQQSNPAGGPYANVLVPASSSTSALVIMNKSTVLQTFQAYRTSFAPETISPERNERD